MATITLGQLVAESGHRPPHQQLPRAPQQTTCLLGQVLRRGQTGALMQKDRLAAVSPNPIRRLDQVAAVAAFFLDPR
jgi:hypothetical protein